MFMLPATTQGQGTRHNDYSWAVEGELVGIDEPCGRDRTDPDGGCGRGRGFFGLSSHRATTTAVVRDLDLTRADLTAALAGYYETGWGGVFTAAEIAEEVGNLLELAACWPAGTVVERRLDLIQVRPAFT